MKVVRDMCDALIGQVYADSGLDLRAVIGDARETHVGYVTLDLLDMRTREPIKAKAILGAWTIDQMLRGEIVRTGARNTEIWLEGTPA